MQGCDLDTAADRPGDPPRVARPSGLMFWLLAGLGTAGFVPCVVLPAWRDHQAVALAAQTEERMAAAMRQTLQRQRRTLQAIRTDPGVAARLAQRELTYQYPGERQVVVPGVATLVERTAVEPVAGVEPPVAVARLAARLPQADYDALFCDEPTRTVLMALSGAVMAAAFALYPPGRSPANRTPPDKPPQPSRQPAHP